MVLSRSGMMGHEQLAQQTIYSPIFLEALSVAKD
jgi:hypothetical protein